jgi:hypothetical protein
MTDAPEVRPVDRYEWERVIRRARLGGVIAGNAKGSRGGVSAAAFKAVAFTWSSHGNADGSDVYPGDATLAVESEVGLKAVKAIKAAMVRLGLTTRTKAGARRQGQPDIYRLTLPVSPALDELIEVLSPDEVRAAAVATYEKQRGTQGGSSGPPTMPVLGGVVRGPEDPRQLPEGGPGDPLQPGHGGSQRGSDGTADSGCRGSDGTVVGGPMDRDTRPIPNPKRTTISSSPDSDLSAADPTGTPAATRERPDNGLAIYSPKPPGKTARNGAKHRQPSLIPKTTPRPPEAIQIVLDNLRRAEHPDVTIEDAKAVHRAVVRQYGAKVTPRYLRTMAGNTGFAGYYADVKAARGEAVAKELTRLREAEPECEHGTAAGHAAHPTTGRPLCPQCRAGQPAVADDQAPTPAVVVATLDAYRTAYLVTHQRAPGAELLVALTQQAAGLHARGAAAEDLTQLAQRAGAAGIGLLAAATQGGTTQ